MIANLHRHTKGKIDLGSEICPDSYLENSVVSEGCDIYASKLYSTWTERTKAYRLWSKQAYIHNSTLITSVVQDSTVDNSTLYDSVVLDGSIIRNVSLRGATVKDSTVKAGQIGAAILEGVTIDKPMRIGTGYWTRSPRFLELQDENFDVTESTNGHAYIGCRRRPITVWIQGANRFGKVMGWKQETIDEVVENLRSWL